MAYIAPNSWITLCRDVPLDSSYDHQVTFPSQNAQRSYFLSKRYVELGANSYQRAMNGKLRIACTMEQAIQCNYLYFSNDSFEDKWFYAFITGWEYVNNITTEITYEIDVFQTFWFDVRLLNVFVEREHSNTDVIGENLVAENLELGDYIVGGRAVLQPYAITDTVATNACVIFLTTFNDDAGYTDFMGGFANSVYTGLNVIKKETVNEVQSFITGVTNANKIDGIIAAYMCPFSPNTYDTLTWEIAVNKPYTTLANGYVPKNNKLFTYPYQLLHIHNDVATADFHYEYFNGANCQFRMRGVLIPQPTLTLLPLGYNLPTGSDVSSSDQRISTTDYPQVAVNSDVFKVYLAQNAASLPAKMISTIGNGTVQAGLGAMKGAAVGLATGGLGGAALGAVQGAALGALPAANTIRETLAQLHDINTKPPQQNGTQSCLTDYAIGCKVFYADNLCIRPEFAAIIDDYFNLYGYATHRVKQPNITGRPHWNYVKTVGNTVDALGVPDPYLQHMNNAFNRGITFWHDPDEVGTYTLDNRPV